MSYLCYAPFTLAWLAVMSNQMVREVQFAMAPKVLVSGKVTAVNLSQPPKRHLSYVVDVRLGNGQVIQPSTKYASGAQPLLEQSLTLHCTQQPECRDASRLRPYGGWFFRVILLILFAALNVPGPWLLWRTWKAERKG